MSEVTDAPRSHATAQKQASDQGSFIWYELMTTDADAAGRFYTAVVPGWTFGDRMPGDLDYRGIGRSDGGYAGGVLQLDDSMRSHGAHPMWLGYVNVGDVDEAAASIEQAGGKALMPPFDVPNVGRIAMLADPQGAPFYVMKPIPPADKPEAKSDVFSPSDVQRVGWNELSTSDPAAARKFYSEQFGWGTDEYMDMGELGEYRFLEQGGIRIGALCGVMQGQQPKWRYYVRVPSISEAKAKAEAAGGAVHMGPHQVPTGDWILIGSDPQGAEFALVGGE